MTKNDLKAGYVVVRRNRDVRMVMVTENTMIFADAEGNHGDIRNIKEDLTSVLSSSYDIVEVYGFSTNCERTLIVDTVCRPLLWKRKEEPKSETEILKEAIRKYGDGQQMAMAMEECAELIQAINKHCRYTTGETQERLAEEIADVQIMIEQLKMICNITDEHIQSYRNNKIKRLEERLQGKP